MTDLFFQIMNVSNMTLQSPARLKDVISAWKLMIAGAVERVMSSKIRPIPQIAPHVNPSVQLTIVLSVKMKQNVTIVLTDMF